LAQILIVDDDHQLRQSFERLLLAEGHEVRTAASGEAGIEAMRASLPEVVIMDVRMPGMSGLEAFRRMREIAPKLPVIVMTAFGTTETAIEATKMGAFDYILKPFDIPQVLKLITDALAAGRFMRGRVEVDASSASESEEALVGRSQAMQEIYKAIGRAAPTDATVLIRGESGTGKELVAKAIYQHSLRADKPFMVINCVAIPETLLESELFGYEKGAFTGASARRVGKIEQAHRGTVFLDEIGDMPLSIQAKILRLLQERHIERLGGRQPIPVDVRIIAATNRDLEKAVAEGQFREDLYYRLKVVTMRLPPLAERAGDTPLLAEYFLARYAREMHLQSPGLTPDAARYLAARPWPGNVRELANTVHKALIFNRGGPLSEAEMREAAEGQERSKAARMEVESDGRLQEWIRSELTAGEGRDAFDGLMDRFGSIIIREALTLSGGNRTRAARMLGLSRPTLLSKIDKYGLRIEAQVSAADD